METSVISKKRLTATIISGALAISGASFGATSATATPTANLATRQLVAKKSFSGGTVTISGTKKVGKTLTAKVSGLHPDYNSGVKYKYQWLQNGSAISGANGKTYKLKSADAGKQISVKVAATKDGYEAKVMKSAQTASISTGNSTTNKPSGGTYADGSRAHPYSFDHVFKLDGFEVKFTDIDGDHIYYNVRNVDNSRADIYYDYWNIYCLSNSDRTTFVGTLDSGAIDRGVTAYGRSEADSCIRYPGLLFIAYSGGHQTFLRP